MAKIVLLNSPKGAGKDTVANAICERLEYPRKASFKAPMFQIALAILGQSNYCRFLDIYDNREQKEKAHDFLMGMTCREFMIWISEDVIKPKFGEKYFGKRLSDLAANSDYPVIVSDCGFEQEVIALIEGGHEVKLVRMHRQGFEFDETDSRNYVYLPACYYGENGYEEIDVDLFDGDPVYTAYELIHKFNLKQH